MEDEGHLNSSISWNAEQKSPEILLCCFFLLFPLVKFYRNYYFLCFSYLSATMEYN